MCKLQVASVPPMLDDIGAVPRLRVLLGPCRRLISCCETAADSTVTTFFHVASAANHGPPEPSVTSGFHAAACPCIQSY